MANFAPLLPQPTPPPALNKVLGEAILGLVATAPQSTMNRGPHGLVRPLLGLEDSRLGDPRYVTKSGNFREPDYVVADRLIDWPWKEIFSLHTGPADQTHINFKELRGVRMFVRRKAKGGPSQFGKRIIIL